MESSIFISNSTPLLDGYEPLNDDDNNNGNEGYASAPYRDETLMQSFLPPLRTAHGSHSAECLLDDIYRYYWLRGLWKFAAAEIGHILLLTWLVLFCIFLGCCVDYGGIMRFNGIVATSLWTFVSLAKFNEMGWYFVVALVVFGIYGAWRLTKFARDLKRMYRVKSFYETELRMTDFDLRTARWADVLAALKPLPATSYACLDPIDPGRMRAVCQSDQTIACIVTKKENFFKKLLELGLFDFVFNLRIPYVHLTYSTDIMMLTRGLQWNIIYCVVNFFFDNELQLKPAFVEATTSGKSLLEARLRARVIALAVLNVLLLPFLAVFILLYAVFRYGEQFYKDPSSIGNRQWALAARWYFRDYDELPHVFEERMRLAGRYAKQYTNQFAITAVEGIARAVAFVIGSIVVWLLLLSFLNDRALLGLQLTPSRTLLWWITILSSIWVVCRGVLQEQQVFYPADALAVVYNLTRRLPAHFMAKPGSQHTLTQFLQLYPKQVVLLLYEFIGLVMTPYILIRRVLPKTREIIEAVCVHARHDDLKHYYFGVADEAGGAGGAESVADFKETDVLRSEQLIPYLQKLDGQIQNTNN